MLDSLALQRETRTCVSLRAPSCSLLTTLTATSFGAEVYRSKAADGTVSYSDRPQGNNPEFVYIATPRAARSAQLAQPGAPAAQGGQAAQGAQRPPSRRRSGRRPRRRRRKSPRCARRTARSRASGSWSYTRKPIGCTARSRMASASISRTTRSTMPEPKLRLMSKNGAAEARAASDRLTSS